MVERIARAICEVARVSPEHWRIYADYARAVLQAVREPTPAMRKAGEVEMKARHPNLDSFNDPYVDSTWKAMIDAALKDPRHG